MNPESRIHDLLRQLVFCHARLKTISRKAARPAKGNPAPNDDLCAGAGRIVHNAEMAPVDSEELPAVLAKDIATEVAVDPEGPEPYRSRN